MNCSWAHHRSRRKTAKLPWASLPLSPVNPFDDFLSIDDKKQFFLPFRNILNPSGYAFLDDIALKNSDNKHNLQKCLACSESSSCHTRPFFTKCWKGELRINSSSFPELVKDNYSIGTGKKTVTDIQYQFQPVKLLVHYPRFRTQTMQECPPNLWPLSFFGLSVTARLAESLALLYATHSQSLLQEGYGVSASQVKAVIQKYLNIYSFVDGVSPQDIVCLSGKLCKQEVLYLLDAKNGTLLDVVKYEKMAAGGALMQLRTCYETARYSHSLSLDASQKYHFTSLSHQPLWQMTVVCTYLERLADLQPFNTMEQREKFLSVLHGLQEIAATTHHLYLAQDVDMEQVELQKRAFSDFIQNTLVRLVDTYIGYDCLLWDFQDALAPDGPVMRLLKDTGECSCPDAAFCDQMVSFARTAEEMTATLPKADFEVRRNRLIFFNPVVQAKDAEHGYTRPVHIENVVNLSPEQYDAYHKARHAPKISDLEALVAKGLLDTTTDSLEYSSF